MPLYQNNLCNFIQNLIIHLVLVTENKKTTVLWKRDLLSGELFELNNNKLYLNFDTENEQTLIITNYNMIPFLI